VNVERKRADNEQTPERARGVAPHRAAAIAAQPHRLRCADGRELAAHWFAARERRAVLVLNPATGFPQSFYFRLADYAAERGYDTLVYDYRGMGASAPANLADESCRMSDWGLLDMRTALATAAEHAAGLPVATLGHSVGGQLLGLLTNHALARAHVQVAVSVGYWPWEAAPFKYLAWWFWRVHGPLMLAIKGYIPTGGGWSGLPLPRGVYQEWRRWCLRTDHFGPDLRTYLTDNAFADIRAPLLNLGFTDDPIATRRTVAGLDQFYPNVIRESRWYSPADIGSPRIGHDGFFASRHRDSLWRPVFDWLDTKLGIAA
jgi:predicted alpha/beta hydrolase